MEFIETLSSGSGCWPGIIISVTGGMVVVGMPEMGIGEMAGSTPAGGAVRLLCGVAARGLRRRVLALAVREEERTNSLD